MLHPAAVWQTRLMGAVGREGLTCPNLHLPSNQKLIYLFRFSRWKNGKEDGVLTISATASLLHHVWSRRHQVLLLLKQAERAVIVRWTVPALSSRANMCSATTDQYPRGSGNTQHSDRNSVKQLTALWSTETTFCSDCDPNYWELKVTNSQILTRFIQTWRRRTNGNMWCCGRMCSSSYRYSFESCCSEMLPVCP